jgi:hypothetical protein
MPPALAATATPRIIGLLSSLEASPAKPATPGREVPGAEGAGREGPGRVLELGFAGIHAAPLELAGWDVVVVEPDPKQAARARERGALVVERAEGRFDAVVAPSDADLTGIDAARIVLVDERGHASMAP